MLGARKLTIFISETRNRKLKYSLYIFSLLSDFAEHDIVILDHCIGWELDSISLVETEILQVHHDNKVS